MTRSIPLLSLIFLIMFALLVGWCMRHHAPQIELDLDTRATKALAEVSGGNSIAVGVEGLDITLSGAVQNEQERQAILEAVGQLVGVRNVHDQLEVEALQKVRATRAQFSATYDGRSVTLNGVVNDSASRASLVGAARYAFKDKQVIDQLQLLDTVPQLWAPLLRTALGELAEFRSGKIQLMEQRLTVSGTTETGDRKITAETTIRKVLPVDAGYTLRMDVAALQADEVQITSCQSDFDRLLSEKVIQFNTGSAVILIDSYPLLDELAESVSQCIGVRIEVRGHTDSAGDVGDNLRLSQLRARAVLKYLADEGVDTSQISARGYGEENPIALNDTPVGRAKNRRIEFVTLRN